MGYSLPFGIAVTKDLMKLLEGKQITLYNCPAIIMSVEREELSEDRIILNCEVENRFTVLLEMAVKFLPAEKVSGEDQIIQILVRGEDSAL